MNRIISLSFSALLATACGQGAKQGSTAPTEATLTSSNIDSDYPECQQILNQSLFNQTSGASKMLVRDIVDLNFYSLQEADAWRRYEEAVKSKNEGGGKAEIAVPDSFTIGMGGGGSGTLDRSKFNEQFNREKTLFNSKVNTQHYTSMSSNFSSYVRDPGSVEAWRACVTKPRAVARLVCYAYRDQSNSVYLQVNYDGGNSAVLQPTVNLTFPKKNIADVTPGQELKLPHGGSEIFVVSDVKDVGFDVPVVGKTPSGTGTFSCTATVPPLPSKLPDSCELQRVRMLVGGFIGQEEYQILKDANWVRAVVGNTQGASSCKDYLNQ